MFIVGSHVISNIDLLIFFAMMQLMSAMIQRMGDKDDDPLPQRAVEGCDSDEWSD